jgi:hypothetical protein
LKIPVTQHTQVVKQKKNALTVETVLKKHALFADVTNVVGGGPSDSSDSCSRLPAAACLEKKSNTGSVKSSVSSRLPAATCLEKKSNPGSVKASASTRGGIFVGAGTKGAVP